VGTKVTPAKTIVTSNPIAVYAEQIRDQNRKFGWVVVDVEV